MGEPRAQKLVPCGWATRTSNLHEPCLQPWTSALHSSHCYRFSGQVKVLLVLYLVLLFLGMIVCIEKYMRYFLTSTADLQRRLQEDLVLTVEKLDRV